MLRIHIFIFLLFLSSIANADDRQMCAAAIEKPQLAVKACERLLRQHLSAIELYETHLRRGGAFAMIDDLFSAVREFNTAIEIDPTKPAAYVLRGRTYFNQGYLNKCIADEKTGIELGRDLIVSSQNPVAYTNLAKCYIDNDQAAEGVQAAEKALLIKPASADVLSSYAEALAFAGKKSLADRYFSTAIQNSPQDMSVYELAITSQLGSGDAEGALKNTNLALSNGAAQPDYWEIHGYRAQAYRLEGKFAQAERELGLAHSTSWLNQWTIQAQVARTLLAEGKLQLALAKLNELFSRNHAPREFQTRGYIHLLLGNFDLAISDFNFSISTSPSVGLYRSYRGIAYIGARKLDSAEADFDNVLANHPNYLGAVFGKARLADLRGNFDEARRGYEIALAIPIPVDFEELKPFRDEAQARLAALPPSVASAKAPMAANVPPPEQTPQVSPEHRDHESKPSEVAAIPVPSPVVPPIVAAKLTPSPTKQEPQIAVTPKAGPPTDPVQLAAYKMLDTHCARCHQTDKTDGLNKAQSKVANILDLQALASDRRWVSPGLPLKSSLYFTVLRREMPYDVFQDGDIDKPMPTDAEADALKAWIVSLAPGQAVSRR